jgi:transposase
VDQVEIITGVERRRRWRLEEKLRIVAESERPGATVSEVARRYEVSRGLLWAWRRQARAGALTAEPTPMFMPMQVTGAVPPMAAEPVVSAPSPGKEAAAEADRIEILLSDGTCVRVGSDVSLVALRRVVAVLRG